MVSKTITKYTGYIFIVVGLVLLSLQAKETYKIHKVVSENNLINCAIIGERLSKYSKEEIYVYTIEYVISGKKYHTDTKNNSSHQEYSVGQELTIFYSSKNPEKAVLNNWDELYGGQVIGYSLSGVFLIAGLICALFSEQLSKIFKPRTLPFSEA